MKRIILIALVFVSVFSSCKKQESDNIDAQLEKDDQLIKDFIKANNINAERDDYGIYYVVTDPGSGNFEYTTSTKIKVKYTGRFLNGQVFDSNSQGVELTLGGETGVIAGWQIGIQKIQKGGKIRLLIPSYYGYGSVAYRGIPANSVLDFDIELLDVTKAN